MSWLHFAKITPDFLVANSMFYFSVQFVPAKLFIAHTHVNVFILICRGAYTHIRVTYIQYIHICTHKHTHTSTQTQVCVCVYVCMLHMYIHIKRIGG